MKKTKNKKVRQNPKKLERWDSSIIDTVPESLQTIVEEYVYVPPKKYTSNYMTLYEYGALVTIRAIQLSMGMRPIIPVDTGSVIDTIEIAKKEIRDNPSGMTMLIRRKYKNSNGDTSYEDRKISELILPRM